MEVVSKRLVQIEKNNNAIKLLKKSAGDHDATIKDLRSKNVTFNKEINSYLSKFGMINLRTDGNQMILAQKLEKKASYGKWDIHELEYNNTSKRFEHKEDH